MESKTKNGISSTELEEQIKLDSIDKDVQDIVTKYAKDRINISSYGDVKSNKGFFLMWVKKDGDLPEGEQVQITTFAQHIDSEDIVDSMRKVLSDMALEQKVTTNIS